MGGEGRSVTGPERGVIVGGGVKEGGEKVGGVGGCSPAGGVTITPSSAVAGVVSATGREVAISSDSVSDVSSGSPWKASGSRRGDAFTSSDTGDKGAEAGASVEVSKENVGNSKDSRGVAGSKVSNKASD